MTKRKTNQLANVKTAGDVAAKPLSSEQERLAEIFRAGSARSSLVPRTEGGGVIHGTPEVLGAFLDVCKTDHYELAVKANEDATIVRKGKDVDKEVDLALLQIEAMKPQSYLETLLAVQMIQVSEGINRCMGQAFYEGQSIQGRESNVNMATKLQRTFTAQVEAMQKLRGKGGQQVRVEHVHVHEGGQAIVGNVNRGEGGRGGQDGN
ncbi:hypothetical protein Gbem_3491 [Citrifermentans bemidjiense Bem]|uniref:Uncharacterized protein n=1 Tax=Citrifermentans bemidjiense (strain ATCC BAA-1014 / DSM 16622 / JCM 12645 / Bem) TaxID=404380 RepID=B5EC28_CITBB|nr:hypothetical protein [Citrifermentans bemidjiense]ACH40484.1 hypothetical protein Gbem_3491 [Citrifermentans bemidjiense Bem]